MIKTFYLITDFYFVYFRSSDGDGGREALVRDSQPEVIVGEPRQPWRAAHGLHRSDNDGGVWTRVAVGHLNVDVEAGLRGDAVRCLLCQALAILEHEGLDAAAMEAVGKGSHDRGFSDPARRDHQHPILCQQVTVDRIQPLRLPATKAESGRCSLCEVVINGLHSIA